MAAVVGLSCGCGSMVNALERWIEPFALSLFGVAMGAVVSSTNETEI